MRSKLLTMRIPRKVSTRLRAVTRRRVQSAKHRRLQILKARQVALSARFEALKFAQARAGRKIKFRRDYITGDAVSKAVSDGVIDRSFFARLLNDYVTSKSERALLGLPANSLDLVG